MELKKVPGILDFRKESDNRFPAEQYLTNTKKVIKLALILSISSFIVIIRAHFVILRAIFGSYIVLQDFSLQSLPRYFQKLCSF